MIKLLLKVIFFCISGELPSLLNHKFGQDQGNCCSSPALLARFSSPELHPLSQNEIQIEGDPVRTAEAQMWVVRMGLTGSNLKVTAVLEVPRCHARKQIPTRYGFLFTLGGRKLYPLTPWCRYCSSPQQNKVPLNSSLLNTSHSSTTCWAPVKFSKKEGNLVTVNKCKSYLHLPSYLLFPELSIFYISPLIPFSSLDLLTITLSHSALNTCSNLFPFPSFFPFYFLFSPHKLVPPHPPYCPPSKGNTSQATGAVSGEQST